MADGTQPFISDRRSSDRRNGERRKGERRHAARSPFRRARRGDERIRALGADMDLVRPEEVMHHVTRAIGERRRFLVANHNLHSLALLRTEPGLASFYDLADLIEVDSTPVVKFTRLLGLQSRIFHRCTYLDWRGHFWSLAARSGWRIYYLGGAPGVAGQAAASLGAQHPGVDIRVRDGFFDATPGSADNADILAELEAFAPHVLFVGMGMPRQELWIADHFDRLPECAVFSVGAAFDYEAGVQKPAPRWMGRMGLEWAFRLVSDPRRLAHRYLVEPWRLAGPAMADVGAAVREGRLLRRPSMARRA